MQELKATGSIISTLSGIVTSLSSVEKNALRLICFTFFKSTVSSPVLAKQLFPIISI